MKERTLTIRECNNGYAVTLCGHEENKGGMSGYQHDEYVLKEDELPADLKAMLNGKFKGMKIETPDNRKAKLDLEDEIIAKTGKEYKETEEDEKEKD